MGRRRNARVLALTFMYQYDLKTYEKMEDIIHYTLFMDEYEVDVVNYATRLASGVVKAMEEVDELIIKSAENWTIGRMATLDRNILRLSIFEMLYEKDVPKNVTINEAVEMAKMYSTEKSGEFVNGILDKISKTFIKDKK
ncbi:MAG TPA: transcription antitermination factor NusB [Candidatus Wallbacteria bacterium]|nr:transcription antitermination factor NusB [Candidatus Wallbacteria bacterium]